MNNKNCFDFLRIVFAVDILLAHLWELSQNKYLYFLSNYTDSNIGIRGFFIISGFLVAKSYANTSSLKKYFLKRAKRILPAYIVVVIFAVLILSFFNTGTLEEYFSNIGVYQYLGWNFIFLNFMHPCLPGVFENNLLCAVNGALWTLKVEEGFYIILPLIFYAIRKTKKSFFVLLSIYFASQIYWYFMVLSGNFELARQLPGQLMFFVVGVFLFLNFEVIFRNRKTLLSIGILGLFFSRFYELNLIMVYPILFGTAIIAFAYSAPLLNNFGKFGDFTYGIYIYHFPIIQVFRHYDLFEKFNPILMGISVILITLIFAVFSWFLVEKRFLDRYKKETNLKMVAV